MKVLKFGGTSVGSADRIKAVARLIQDGERNIVVLSAMSGTTNKLVEISDLLYQNQKVQALKIIEELETSYLNVTTQLLTSQSYLNQAQVFIRSIFSDIRSYAQDSFQERQSKILLSKGEILSTHLMHFYLQEQQLDSYLLPALDYMRIDKDGEPDYFYIRQNCSRLLNEHPQSNLIITQGFICRNNEGEIDNLERGGSDYSAALIGSAIRAHEIQIWTDIDGIHNNDPRVVENTVALRQLSFDEAAELAYFGAKILHPSSIQPAKKENIPVRLKNTLNPQDEGTLITAVSNEKIIKAVAAKDNITAINIKSTKMLLAYGFLSQIFEIFAKWHTPIDMITTSEVAVSLTIDNCTHIDEIIAALSRYGIIEVEHNLSIICIVGDFKANNQGLAAQILNALNEVPIKMISYGGSEHNVSLLVKNANKAKALNSLSNNLLNQQ